MKRSTIGSPSHAFFDYQLHKHIVDTRSHVFVCSRLLFKQQFIYMSKTPFKYTCEDKILYIIRAIL